MGDDTELPRRALGLIVAVAVLAVGAVAFRAPELLDWSNADVAAFAALALAAIFLEQFQLSLRHRTETESFSLTDALWVPGLVLARPSVLTLTVLVGTLAGQTIRRWSPRKIVFNASLFIIAITAAEVLFGALDGGDPTDGRTVAAAVLAMTAFFLINETMVALVIALVEEQPFRGLLVLPEGMNLLNWAGNVAIGLLGAAVWSIEPAAVPLLVAPVLLPYLAYRAWTHSKRRQEELDEQQRMRALYEAGELLFGSVLAPADYRAFLVRFKDTVSAHATELLVVESDRVTVHDSESDAPSELYRIRNQALDTLVRARRGLIAHVTPIEISGRQHGLLVVQRESNLTPTESSLVDALASQVAVKLDNQRLFLEAVEQRARLAGVIANSSDGIVVVAPDGRIISWNPAMGQIVGSAGRTAPFRSWPDVLGLSGDVATSAVASLAREEPQDALIVRQDGSERWIRSTSRPITEPQREFGGYVVIVRDVTAELETERLKSDFVAMVSHELRTPLTPLKGFLTLLLHDAADVPPDARDEYLRIMLRQANRLEGLINDLLDVSRIDAGKLGAELRSIELVEVMADQIRETAEVHPGRSVRFETAEPSVWVAADPLRVRQVMANLVGNALKYSDADAPVDVTLEIQGTQALVSVTDRGRGISGADQDRVFERFQRVGTTNTRSTGGAGLGLYIARHLVEAMGGRLWLESEVGKGARFLFTLQLVSAATGNSVTRIADRRTGRRDAEAG